MRLRKITLREIHLPLIAPFQTSFWRNIAAADSVDRSGCGWRDRLGRIDGGRRSVLLLRDGGNRVAHHPRFSLADAAGQGIRVRGGSVGHACASSRPQHGQGRHSKPRSGTRKRSKRMFRWRNFWAARATRLPAAFRSGFSRRSTQLHRESGKRTGRRIPAHQNKDQAGIGHRAGARAARTISRAFG